MKLISSGFDLAREPESRPAINAPKNIEAVNGINPGKIRVSVSTVKSPVSYQHEYCAAWATASATGNRWQHATENCNYRLTSGQKYLCRTAAAAARDQLTYSNSVSCIAQ